MESFENYILFEKFKKEFGEEDIPHEEELKLTREFNSKYGKDVLSSNKVEFKKDDDGKPVYITFSDTAHFKARIIQRYPDLTAKKLVQIAKTIALGVVRTKEDLFHKSRDNSVLIFSKSKNVGVYCLFHKNNSSTEPYEITFKTILPLGRDAISRSDDERYIVEKVGDIEYGINVLEIDFLGDETQ